ncbi:hypothetical protein VP01_639g4 [Puccinia sorghi]|uniref:NADPH:adrenodoxin oxidoreductase, mitochondrial n=1 Tax=Puccinia sorghi TaxID=27349 RepID=A0A0L6UFY4_9BASI|nr:hypothetical protein VP01_639g4 [Puccinia sorghi]
MMNGQRRMGYCSCHTASNNGRTPPPIRLAICGAGPAGFYAASRLFSLDQQPGLLPRPLAIDLFEALPAPFGLSRYGVAPDHPEVKVSSSPPLHSAPKGNLNCELKFAQVAEHPRFRYFGNTTVLGDDQEEPSWGRASVRLRTLREEYDVVLLSYGAGRDRSLGGLPGEKTLGHILPARAAVEWYNGYPSSTTGADGEGGFVDLSKVERVTIVGMGNVALDIARILLTDINVLARTDISERALAGLARSSVRHVEIVGRRGPLQAAFTTRELRELVGLKDVQMHIDRDMLADAAGRLAEPGALARMPNGRLTKRLMDVMLKASDRRPLPLGSKTCTLSFLREPVAFDGLPTTPGTPARVSAVEWRLNKLDYPSVPLLPVDYSAIKALPILPPLHQTSPTDLVLKSLGYQPILIPPLTYDSQKSRARNHEGRVIGSDDQVIPGLYVTGWLSRGPKGVIGDTMNEAAGTASTIVSDLCMHPPPPPPPASAGAGTATHEPSLAGSQFRINWDMWTAIDRFERARGQTADKPRFKSISVQEMLKIAGRL